MDEEKASGVVIRTSLDTADKQCACLIFISFHTYILRSWKTVFGKGLIYHDNSFDLPRCLS